MGLTREQIMGLNDLKPTVYEVPEWGGSVNLRVMTGHEKLQYDLFQQQKDPEPLFADVIALLVSMVVVDDNNEPIFHSPDEVKQRNAQVIERLFFEAVRVNAANPSAVEDLAKNLMGQTETTQDSTLTSAGSSESQPSENCSASAIQETSHSGVLTTDSIRSDLNEKNTEPEPSLQLA